MNTLYQIFGSVLVLAWAGAPKSDLSLSSLALKPTAEPGAAVTAESKLDAQYVDLKGRRYVKFKSKDGAIYLPAIEHASPDQLDEAFCTNQAPHAKGHEIDVARVDRGLVNAWQPYIALVQQTIQTKCKNVAGGGPTPGAGSGDQPSLVLNPMLELGVAKDSRNKDGTRSRTRVFTRPASAPNLNLGKEF